MSIAELRTELEKLRGQVETGDTGAAIRTIDQAIKELDGDRLLTTTEAAEMLHIRSVNTLKALCRHGDIAYVMRGNRMMVPLSEIERVQENPVVRGIRASDRVHDELEGFGGDGLTEQQMEDLHASRPGVLPWERQAQ